MYREILLYTSCCLYIGGVNIKKIRDLKFLIFIILSILIILVNIYIYLSKPKTNKINVSTTYKNTILNGIVDVNSSDEIKFNTNFQYQGNGKHNYELSIYWDFEQVEFYVNNEPYKSYPIEFKKNNYNENIEIKLNKHFENKTHTLLVVIKDSEFDSETVTELATPYKFIVTDSLKESSIQSKSPFKIYESKLDYLNVVNGDFIDDEEKYKNSENFFKDKTLEVNANTEIELAVRFKNFVNDGNQLLLLELNNKQIPIDNKPFLVYELNPSIGFIYDKIKITTPSEPGEYRLESSIITNPFSETYNNIFTPFFSYKLIVK